MSTRLQSMLIGENHKTPIPYFETPSLLVGREVMRTGPNIRFVFTNNNFLEIGALVQTQSMDSSRTRPEMLYWIAF